MKKPANLKSGCIRTKNYCLHSLHIFVRKFSACQKNVCILVSFGEPNDTRKRDELKIVQLTKF